MEKFVGWENYVEKISYHFNRSVKPDDAVVLLGDLSWAMTLKGALKDLKFIDNLPGTKYLIKGNHDYWWSTVRKMENFFTDNGLNTLKILHNSSVAVEGLSLCGTRGWLFESSELCDPKILAREAGRLRTSLQSADSNLEKVVFLHFPPLYGEQILVDLIDVMKEFHVKRCYYGHIHSSGCHYAINGSYLGIDFHLVSGDYIKFNPVPIKN